MVDAQGETATRASAVLSNIRDSWAPTLGHDVDGAGEDRDDGVVRWTFVFGDDRWHEASEPSDASSDDSTSPGWTMTVAG